VILFDGDDIVVRAEFTVFADTVIIAFSLRAGVDSFEGGDDDEGGLGQDAVDRLYRNGNWLTLPLLWAGFSGCFMKF
jgi:hypothetical protein